ncbi:hypothetical protein CYMTET_53565 [Cymbomonas tetramitiformis]|uniref:Uncharacterized protein n=1 Tax=Cymbomonas tetramitiformis TaxID=36881 RepID=A0AAE0BI29_9CHLO|nr:hypothetical protein CYMTET_53565 [Cymbomonas tetramitiformis]
MEPLEEFEQESKPQLRAEPPVFDNQDLSTLLLQQMKLVEDLTRKLMLTEQRTDQCIITFNNAPKVAQSVLKSLGSDTKYSGSERNSYESWTRFSTQLQSAVSFYPELVELVSEDSISDIANLKDVQGTPVPGEDLAPDQTVGAVTKPKSVITVDGAATLPRAVSSTILVQVTTGDAFDLVRRCGSDGLKAYHLGRGRAPSFNLLQQRCDYYFVNVLQQTHTTDVAAAAKGVLADRRRQLEQKNANDAKKLVCAVCSGSHPSESCWIMRPGLMEEYIKEHPDREKNTRRLYASKKKRLARDKTETDKTDTACAAISVSSSAKMTDEIWDAEEHDKVPCACPAVQHCAD